MWIIHTRNGSFPKFEEDPSIESIVWMYWGMFATFIRMRNGWNNVRNFRSKEFEGSYSYRLLRCRYSWVRRSLERENVEVTPQFCVIDALLRKQKWPRSATFAKELWQIQKSYWINTVWLQTKTSCQTLCQSIFIPLCPCIHWFSLLVFILLLTFIQISSLAWCMCCPVTLGNYWRSVLSQCLWTLKKQRAFLKRNLVPVNPLNQLRFRASLFKKIHNKSFPRFSWAWTRLQICSKQWTSRYNALFCDQGLTGILEAKDVNNIEKPSLFHKAIVHSDCVNENDDATWTCTSYVYMVCYFYQRCELIWWSKEELQALKTRTRRLNSDGKKLSFAIRGLCCYGHTRMACFGPFSGRVGEIARYKICRRWFLRGRQ